MKLIPFTAKLPVREVCRPVDGNGVHPETVLQELFELLEAYGPAWYTEDHHRRAIAALDTSR